MIELSSSALRLSGRERVLEVGTGSGYQTAILAEMLPLEAVVRTMEVRAELLQRAQDTLLSLGYSNIDFRLGDGALGWPEAAPFDAILVAAAPQHVPAPLLEQLAPGGRLVIPVGSDLDHQDLELWRKDPRTGRCHRAHRWLAKSSARCPMPWNGPPNWTSSTAAILT